MKQTYLRPILIFLLVFSGKFMFAQFGLPTGFDVKTFAKNEDQAIWFTQYDSAYQAVATFDHITAGKDYICYQDKKNWKVVVGTADAEKGFKDEKYYIIDSKKVVTAAAKKFDTLQVQAMGKALYNANLAISKSTIKAPADWARFVKVAEDKSITVWEFCQADGSSIWYGPECIYYYSANGTDLMTSKVVNKTAMVAGVSGTTMNLSCPTDKMPTIGTMYLARKYMLTYNTVNIAYKTGTSTLIYKPAEQTYSWEHVAN